MTAVLDLQSVTIVRGATTILDELSWTVREGERWVVLGRNGAGKTTLLQVASGRMHPTQGSVDVLGSRLGRVDVFELRPRIGLSSAALAEQIAAAGSSDPHAIATHLVAFANAAGGQDNITATLARVGDRQPLVEEGALAPVTKPAEPDGLVTGAGAPSSTNGGADVGNNAAPNRGETDG